MSVMFTEKYRPYKLSDMVGQDKAKRTAGAWFRTDRIPRTILITGDTSSGKTTISRIIGRAALCHALKDGEPCGKCTSCLAFDKGSHLDFIENNSASDRGIDAMREIALKSTLRPLAGKKRIIVLDECHAITGPAFQALLKTLEEPPEHIVFILATTNPEKIPATVLGRCSKLPLAHISVEECVELMTRVSSDVNLAKSGISDDHLKKIAVAVGAHPRNALHALDQVYSLVLDAQSGGSAVDAAIVSGFINQVAVSDIETAAAAIVRSILTGKPGGAMKRAEDCRGESDVLLTKICGVLRQAMMLSTNPKLMDPYFADVFADIGIFGFSPQNRETILEAYSTFTKLRIACSNHMVPVGEVIDESIARASLLCQSFLNTQKPKKAEDKVAT